MVPGDEARRAGAGAITFERRARRRLDLRMMRQVEIVVARERHQPPAVAQYMDAVSACRVDQAAAQLPRFEVTQFLGGELIERGHGSFRLTLGPCSLNPASHESKTGRGGNAERRRTAR